MLPFTSHSGKRHYALREGTNFGTEMCPSPGQEHQPCLELHRAMQLSPRSPTTTWDG